MSDGFEWDAEKARSNADRHGISFEVARGVFRDPFAVEFEDDRFDYGEDRLVIIGRVDARLIVVVYTLRRNVIRLISARGAEPYERRLYAEQNRWP